MIYGLIILSIVVVILSIKLARKTVINKQALREVQEAVRQKKNDLRVLTDQYKIEQQHLADLKQQHVTIEQTWMQYAATKRAELQRQWEDAAAKQKLQIQLQEEKTQLALDKAGEAIGRLDEEVAAKQQEYESLIAPMQQLEKNQLERLFYTIQVPEEYRGDIEFLLTNVAEKVNHPDIISKLVWQEYVKPYLDDTFKRIEIAANPGIYKLTCLLDNKCYIGKSTEVKKRIADHFKSSVGIKSIADQAVHHAILQTGLWNWTIEILCYCDKDALNEKEKFYIDTFKAQEWGYNKKAGG